MDENDEYPMSWPVDVCAIRRSPLAVILDSFVHKKEDKLSQSLFLRSMDLDYYLSSSYYRHSRIVNLYPLLLKSVKGLELLSKNLGYDQSAFSAPCKEAYIAYMEFDSFISVVRVTQDKLIFLLSPIFAAKYGKQPKLSMNFYADKWSFERVFHPIINAYWESSGKYLRDLRVIMNHNARVSPYPNAKYDSSVSGHL